MRSEAISGTNLFGYKERQNSTENAADLLQGKSHESSKGGKNQMPISSAQSH